MNKLIVLCAAVLASSSLPAQTYKWVDEFKADLRHIQDTSRVLPQARVAQAAGPRGMSFDIFVRLQNGMSEGELVLRAGRPDAVGRGELGIIYYYFPTGADPFVTMVTVSQGRIVNIERTRKTF